MKKYLNLKAIFLSALVVVLFSCQEDQDVADIISTDDYPIATFTFNGGATSFNEKDEPIFVYDVVLDKPSLRAIDFSAVQVGGTAVLHEDFDVVNTSIAPYTTTGQVMIMIHNDTDVEGTETLDIEIQSGPALSNKFLVNPSSDFPTLNLEIQDYIFCFWTLEATDTYGDGWNGASIRLTEGSDVYDFANSDPDGVLGSETETIMIPVTDGADYTFEFVSGDWDGEIAYTLTSPDGSQVFSDSVYPATGLITSGTNVCN